MKNQNLHKARKVKNDEFYTLMADVENELQHYTEHFKGKSVYCNCDDFRKSNFVKYFIDNFEKLGLARLEATHYCGDYLPLFQPKPPVYHYIMERGGKKQTIRELGGEGQFDSRECEEILKRCDIVATNPPFSLFGRFVVYLMGLKKKFAIIGGLNAVTYKDVFPQIKLRNVWLGVNSGGMDFRIPDDAPKMRNTFIGDDGKRYARLGNTCWFSNMDNGIKNPPIPLTCKYSPEKYPKYDNRDAIEVGKICEIPYDYDSVMGVPITILEKYNPDQFEILGVGDCDSETHRYANSACLIDGDNKFTRIFIKRKV